MVSDVARVLGVCAATVYKLCARGQLEHLRILNSIRVKSAALDAFVAAMSRAGSVARVY